MTVADTAWTFACKRVDAITSASRMMDTSRLTDRMRRDLQAILLTDEKSSL